ncbi:MAG: septum formation initiator family protein [Planctomycetes bacterium]|nr:septum formation initiator family protein [Planctomycetota bacterium]
MSPLRPLFRFDPGWLFTIAGLAIMVVSALLPAQHDVAVLKEQLARLEQEEKVNLKRIDSYKQFLAELKSKNPSLLTRLAASQLNLMPEGEAPVLMATSMEHTVSDWIEATVPPEAFEPNLIPDTLLTRLASGQRRLWLMGGGALIVFIGLTTGIPLTPSNKFVATPMEQQWLELAESRSGAAADPRAALGLSPDSIEPPGAEFAGDWNGDALALADADLPTESMIDASVEEPIEQWSWATEEEPYFVVSSGESGDSVSGAQAIDSSGGGDEFWPRSAD